jgi:hypothetical protein
MKESLPIWTYLPIGAMQDFDLGQTSDESGTIGFFVVSLRLAAGVRTRLWTSCCEVFRNLSKALRRAFTHKPRERTALKDLPKLALGLLRKDLEKLKAGEIPSNTTKDAARRV